MVFIKNLIMKKYILNTQIAKFEIQSEPHGEWDLWINKMPTLTFESPEAAALAVFEKDQDIFYGILSKVLQEFQEIFQIGMRF